MSDDTTTPATDTVDTSAPEEGHAPAGETTDYEKRYNDLRSEFDRRNQTLSEYEQTFQGLSDPETRAEILAQFGLEVEDDEEELDTPEYEDPYETLNQRLDRLESEKQQAEEAAAEQARQDAVSDHIIAEVEKLQTSSGEELTDFEWRVVAQEAQRLQAESNARAPMVQEAWDALHGTYDRRLSKAFQGKPNRGRPPQGQSASKQPDLSKGSDRADYIDSKLQGWE